MQTSCNTTETSHNEIRTKKNTETSYNSTETSLQHNGGFFFFFLNHNTIKLSQTNGNKPQHNGISTTQQKQVATQQNSHKSMETNSKIIKKTILVCFQSWPIQKRKKMVDIDNVHP